ncbi:MAG: radical SAM protein [Candidatus Caldarchaeum sp.]
MGISGINKSQQAAMKAWETIRARRIAEMVAKNQSLTSFFVKEKKVRFGSYVVNLPLIKPSKLTRKDGVGKELSDGWAVNFAVGCLFGCRFCYVDAIHKLYSSARVGEIVQADWGYYFAVPSNLEEAIEATPWHKWRGEEVLMSSTHDPYLPQLKTYTRKILEKMLGNGVRVCIQTRSPLVLEDLDLLKAYREQVRLQVSVATLNTELAKIIEPRVVAPHRRLEILTEAKKNGIKTGIIVAPILPPCRLRPSVEEDLRQIFEKLAETRPDHVYGESLHVRGVNMTYLSEALGERLTVDPLFDRWVAKLFTKLLHRYNLKGRYWAGR